MDIRRPIRAAALLGALALAACAPVQGGPVVTGGVAFAPAPAWHGGGWHRQDPFWRPHRRHWHGGPRWHGQHAWAGHGWHHGRGWGHHRRW